MSFAPLRALRYQFLKVLRLKDDPHKVALGFALGVFVGFTPTIPLQTYMAIGLAFIFRGSAIAAAAAVWISNPLTLWPFYYGDFVVGKLITGSEVDFSMAEQFMSTVFSKAGGVVDLFRQSDAVWTLLHTTWDAFVLMMLGGVVLGVPGGFLGYYLMYFIIDSNRRRRERRRARKITEAQHRPNNS